MVEVTEHIAQARAALLAAAPVDWTGAAAAAFDESLGELLTALVGLGHAADQTETAVARHHAAVAAVSTGPVR